VPVASVSQFFGIGMGVGANQAAGEPNSGLGGGGTARVKARPIALAEIMRKALTFIRLSTRIRALTAGLLFAAWAVFWAAPHAGQLLQVSAPRDGFLIAVIDRWLPCHCVCAVGSLIGGSLLVALGVWLLIDQARALP
jgi:hypothetical protein